MTYRIRIATPPLPSFTYLAWVCGAFVETPKEAKAHRFATYREAAERVTLSARLGGRGLLRDVIDEAGAVVTRDPDEG